MKLLITGAGGAAAISVWKSLGADHDIYMADIDPCAAGLYLVPADRRLLLPRGDAPDYVSHVLDVCKKQQIDVVIPTVDTELYPLASQAILFEQQGISLPLCPPETLRCCRDKYELLTLCQDTGFVPQFQILTDRAACHIAFPCFAKPRVGAGSAGAMILHHKQELAALPADGSYLIQELLGGDEYSVDVYIHSSGQPMAAVPRLRMKVDSGIAVAAQTRIMPDLVNMALTIAKRANIRYVANVQFKANAAGHFKLLEINPRFPGTLPLTAAAGVDIPKLLLQDIAGEIVPGDTLLPYKELMVVRYWTETFVPTKEWSDLCKT